MKYIIAVRHTGQKGKSSTIKSIADSLLETYPRCKRIFPDPFILPRTKDFRIILGIRKIIVGLESQGDPGTQLLKRLRQVAKFDCDIIYCTCRSSGQTVWDIEKVAKEFSYKIIWTSPYIVDDETDSSILEERRTIINDLKGVHLHDLIVQLGVL